jgi:hypothetical protein
MNEFLMTAKLATSKRYRHSVKSPRGKTKYYVFDGLIRYGIKIEDTIKCQCSNEPCVHIIHLLFEYFKLPAEIAYYVIIDPDLQKTFVNNYQSEILVEILEESFHNKFREIECGICLEKLEIITSDNTQVEGFCLVKIMGDYNLYQCPICKKYLHNKCHSKMDNDRCPYCGLGSSNPDVS